MEIDLTTADVTELEKAHGILMEEYSEMIKLVMEQDVTLAGRLLENYMKSGRVINMIAFREGLQFEKGHHVNESDI